MHWHGHIYAQNIFIIGATGGVGGELIRQIYESDWGPDHLHPTRILGIANSKKILLADPDSMLHGLSWSDIQDIKKDLHRMGTSMRDGYTTILESLKILGIHIQDIVFVDTTADSSRSNLDFHMEVVRRGGKIVTANKNPLALSTMTEFRELTQDRNRYAYRASVMAGGPAVNELIGANDTKNTIHSIEGCFSGTLAYICSELEKGILFSTIVRDAHAKKYTEPNPWDDLSGYDVAKKIIILARTAGYDVSIDTILIHPFIPASFAVYTDDEFFEAIQSLDQNMHTQMSDLLERGQTIRYIASVKIEEAIASINVSIQEVSQSSPLGSLSGTNNKVVIETNCFTTEFARPGAGLVNTANSIRVDLAGLLEDRIA